MTLDQLLNPQHHPLLTEILLGVEWFLLVVVPAGLFLAALALSLPAARRGHVVPNAFFWGTFGYLAGVGLSGNNFGPPWLVALFFFAGIGISVGRVELTSHWLLDAVTVGVGLALGGTYAVGGALSVFADGLWPHLTSWLVACAAGASIVAGLRRYRRRDR